MKLMVHIGFRDEMVNDLQGFSAIKQSGLFINSCFDHCQSERQERWLGDNSPAIGNKVSDSYKSVSACISESKNNNQTIDDCGN